MKKTIEVYGMMVDKEEFVGLAKEWKKEWEWEVETFGKENCFTLGEYIANEIHGYCYPED